MDPWFGDVHRASIAVLRRAGFRVVVPDAQTCCGALAAHDGAAARAKKMADTNDVAFSGFDLVVTNSAGCGAHMKDHALAGSDAKDVASRVRDITEVVAAAIQDGRLPSLGATGRRVAIQDPCHLRHAQRVIQEPRLIVGAAGYEPIDIDPLALCCGAAGVYSLLRPDTSAELGRRKAEQVQAAGVRLVASANPGCEMQLRSYLGRGYRIAHPVEIFAEAIDGAEA
jgi:glycolate oxidase iron-sulfur subunit